MLLCFGEYSSVNGTEKHVQSIPVLRTMEETIRVSFHQGYQVKKHKGFKQKDSNK